MRKYETFSSFSPAYASAAQALGAKIPVENASAFSGPLTGFRITGNKLNDVTLLRDMAGIGAKEAKDIVEKIYEAQENVKYGDLDRKIDALFAEFTQFTMSEIYSRFNKYADKKATQ